MYKFIVHYIKLLGDYLFVPYRFRPSLDQSSNLIRIYTWISFREFEENKQKFFCFVWQFINFPEVLATIFLYAVLPPGFADLLRQVFLSGFVLLTA